jgi:C1A family cysteine protease
VPSIIHDTTSNDILFPKGFGRGAEPCDYTKNPPTLRALPKDMVLIPRSEWDARIKEQEERQSSLEHIRMTGANGSMIPSLDQNGQGYCWAYSVTGSIMMARARDNQPYTRLSAHGVACKVKGFKDEGGWCGLSAEFIRKNGVPSVQAWPEKSMARTNDNAATWEDAKKYIITEDWVDLNAGHVADQNLTIDQIATLLLTNNPLALDFAWWGHSVCGIRWCKIEAGSYGPKILNSWTDQWEDNGMSILQGEKAKPMGAVGTVTVRASA